MANTVLTLHLCPVARICKQQPPFRGASTTVARKSRWEHHSRSKHYRGGPLLADWHICRATR